MRLASRHPHLWSLALGWLLLAPGTVTARWVAQRLERDAVAHGRRLPSDETNRGLAIQRAGLRRNDVLILFGSSEVARQSPFRAMEFYQTAPTGFRVIGVGARGTPLVMTAFNLGALGEDLAGRRVAVSVSHTFFHEGVRTDTANDIFLGTFSLQHASQIAFGSGLEMPLKRRLAARILQQGAPLDDEPLIRAGLRRLADSSLASRLAYAALRPAGTVQLSVLEVEDHLRALRDLAAGGRTPAPATRGAPIDWAALIDSAERLFKASASDDSFGLDGGRSIEYRKAVRNLRGTRTDSAWRRDVASAPTWADLDLLLDILTSVGARPLLLNVPYKGAIEDYAGTSSIGRRIYYDSLRAKAARARVPLRDFAEYEGDRWFTRDQYAHLSPKGWIFYDRALDEFVQSAR